MHPEQITELIRAGLDCAHLELDGDGQHFEALIVSAEFAGKNRVQRQQRVYQTLKAKLDTGELHAISFKTLTPTNGAPSVDKLLIQGGQPLSGEVAISGAKNAALPIICASLLSADALRLSNVPHLNDIATMLRLLAQMGVGVTLDGPEGLVLDGQGLNSPVASYEMVKTMRASILVLGPLLARCGEAKVSLPGGCAIGARPVDQHIKGLQAMGAQIKVEQGYIHAKVGRLKGARICTDMVTVTGTENLMMAACLAEGETVIENAAREPEVVDLANCLVSMGARISEPAPTLSASRAWTSCTGRATRSCRTASKPAPTFVPPPPPGAMSVCCGLRQPISIPSSTS